MREDIPVQGKEKYLRWVVSSGGFQNDCNPNAPAFEDVLPQRTQRCEETSRIAFIFTRSAGRTKKIRIRSSKQTLIQDPSLGQEHSLLSRVHAPAQHEQNSEIERIMYDYNGDWVKYSDRRSCCLWETFGHDQHRSIIGRHSPGKFCEVNAYSNE